MHIQDNDLINSYQTIIKKIDNACQSCGRDPNDVSLLAVSKVHTVEKIAALHDATGHRAFGENYLQELETKAETLASHNLEWHFIGHLQSNKIQRIVKHAACIHTVDSEKQLRFISKYAEDFGKTPYPIYLAVNLANEPQKSGVNRNEVRAFGKKIMQNYPSLKLLGLMCVPPKEIQDDSATPHNYQMLSELKEGLGESKLSLGMSGDLNIAIRAGSTCVRIGSAIFGERKK